MTRKQYRRKMDFIKGYKRGYHERRGIPTNEIQSKSQDYKRGYIEARKDYKGNEPPQY